MCDRTAHNEAVGKAAYIMPAILLWLKFQHSARDV
ncbi:MAG: hypothetical protein Ta2A_23690 [Treponemataceae bacterium]|nr:MAG: hypothetical protein Ta2A_23690 [Treponemataceae bacterium]